MAKKTKAPNAGAAANGNQAGAGNDEALGEIGAKSHARRAADRLVKYAEKINGKTMAKKNRAFGRRWSKVKSHVSFPLPVSWQAAKAVRVPFTHTVHCAKTSPYPPAQLNYMRVIRPSKAFVLLEISPGPNDSGTHSNIDSFAATPGLGSGTVHILQEALEAFRKSPAAAKYVAAFRRRLSLRELRVYMKTFLREYPSGLSPACPAPPCQS
jgi:hypothetical protein